jgi:uncharacterized membrane protein
MNLVAKINTALSKLVGPNAAHMLDSLIAFELTAAGVAAKSSSARHYAAAHPGLAIAFTVAPPVLTALASKFRKAATSPTPPADSSK